jgi:hypothetical protein
MTAEVYELDVVCRHCGRHLKALAGVEPDGVAAGRAQLQQAAQDHCNEVGRPIAVTVRVMLLQTAEFAPRSD